MTENVPFKHYYGVQLAALLADKVALVHPAFDGRAFVAQVAARIDALELKDRVRLISATMREYLPADYPAALDVLLNILGDELDGEAGMFNKGYWVMPIAHFVQTYGLEHFDRSINALYEITKRFSSEEAVRPYLVRYPEQTLERLRVWVHDENAHVRRWVSEGTRPRLPWAMRLDQFVRDPSPVLELLEHLRDDASLYVRKSVANNLNDIGKDHPERVVATLARWSRNGSERTAWITRHALRTQIKHGDAAALALIGYANGDGLACKALTITPDRVRIGEKITITVEIANTGTDAQNVLVDYAIHFVKATGKTSAKVFKWTTLTLDAGKSVTLTKNHALHDVSVRKHFAGRHQVQVQVNGRLMGSGVVEVL